MGSSKIFDTSVFCGGRKPEPLDVSKWKRQIALWEEWNAEALRPEDKIEWETRTKEDRETGRTYQYRIVYEYVKDLPEAARIVIEGDDVRAFSASGEEIDSRAYDYILDIAGAASVEVVDGDVIVYDVEGAVLDVKVPARERTCTGVLIPVNANGDIVYNSRGRDDLVAANRRDMERKRKAREEARGIKYRAERLQEKASMFGDLDMNIALAGADEEEASEIGEMITSARARRE
jgi:hypothetical protein